jgi:hypothetical protein
LDKYGRTWITPVLCCEPQEVVHDLDLICWLAHYVETYRSTRERHREGIAIARQKNTYEGRVKVLNAGKLGAVKEHISAGVNKAKVAREFGISRPTLYAHLSDP